MRYDGIYKAYKLYSVNEEDIAETGGADGGRYIKNKVLVFLPNSERPEIGMERWSAESIEAAKKKIDEQGKKTMTEVIQAATEKSREIETLAEQTRNLVSEEERKNAGQERSYHNE